MIGRLAGRIAERGGDHVLIDVRGVGYVVQVSQRTLAALPPIGQAAALWTELLVREDALTLVGFPTLHEKEWHRLLMTVQGVGSKAAMAILGTLGAEGVGRALALGDWAAIKAAPGIGPKTAQRVLMELKDKAHTVMALAGETEALSAAADPEAVPEEEVSPAPFQPAGPAGGGNGRSGGQAAASAGGSATAQAEALSALTNLGYAPSEAVSAVARAAAEAPDAATPALIRAALKLLAPKP